MLKQIFAISKYPNLISDKELIDKIGTVLKTYGFVLLALIFIAAPITKLTDSFVVHILHFKAIAHQSKDNFKQLLQKHYYFSLIYICLIGPILEETVFRLPLSFKRTHIALGLSCAVFLFGLSIKSGKLNDIFDARFILLIRVAIIAATYFVVKWLLPSNIQLSHSTKKWLIILSICLFGLMHVTNFSSLQWPIIWIYPLFVVPQLAMGWLITYVRFKNGFIWGIALHCLINSVAMVLTTSHTDPIKAKPTHAITTNTKADSDSTAKTKPKPKK